MNPMSAAIMIAAWIDAHDGLRPQARECKNSNGLPHHATLYRMFGGVGSFGQIIAYADKMARISCASSASHGILRTCIGRDSDGQDCTNTFTDNGAEQRFCPKCRYRKSFHAKHDISTSIDVSVNHVRLERWGMYIHSAREALTT
jgi:hypothetical protein